MLGVAKMMVTLNLVGQGLLETLKAKHLNYVQKNDLEPHRLVESPKQPHK